MFKDELHLHLFGCLSAEDLWTLGKKRWQHKTAELAWYAKTFEQAYGRLPAWQHYWTSAEGLSLLKRDYLFTAPADFKRFQASFNLIIALFTLKARDTEVVEHVLANHKQAGYRYCEYRILYPFRLNEDEASLYFQANCQAVARFEDSNFQARLAISMARDNATLLKQYAFLKQWLKKHPDLAKYIVALDFCFDEEGFPPKDKKGFFAKVRQDNQEDPSSALALLYHVGESFTRMTVISAARWVWQAHSYGAHRLGHAIALGLDPRLYIKQTLAEPSSERRDHLEFLLAHHEQLAARGYHCEVDKLKSELSQLQANKEALIQLEFTEALAEDTYQLQKALMADLRDQKALIESCPTSNIRIANLKDYAYHPIGRFIDERLRVVVSTDDPGILAISYEDELKVCEALNIGKEQVLARREDRSAFLSGRLTSSQ